MENSAKLFLGRDLQQGIKTLQATYFNIIDDIRASDADNLASLKEILKDDELAAKFHIFQENRLKAIRKRILDGCGNLSREVDDILMDYDVGWAGDTEIKGTFKKPNEG